MAAVQVKDQDWEQELDGILQRCQEADNTLAWLLAEKRDPQLTELVREARQCRLDLVEHYRAYCHKADREKEKAQHGQEVYKHQVRFYEAALDELLEAKASSQVKEKFQSLDEARAFYEGAARSKSDAAEEALSHRNLQRGEPSKETGGLVQSLAEANDSLLTPADRVGKTSDHPPLSAALLQVPKQKKGAAAGRPLAPTSKAPLGPAPTMPPVAPPTQVLQGAPPAPLARPAPPVPPPTRPPAIAPKTAPEKLVATSPKVLLGPAPTKPPPAPPVQLVQPAKAPLGPAPTKAPPAPPGQPAPPVASPAPKASPKLNDAKLATKAAPGPAPTEGPPAPPALPAFQADDLLRRDKDLATLMEMGYEHEVAARALDDAGGNWDQALEMLLSGATAEKTATATSSGDKTRPRAKGKTRR